MDCLQGPETIESTVHYFPILDTYEASNLFKSHLYLNLRCCLTSLLGATVAEW